MRQVDIIISFEPLHMGEIFFFSQRNPDQSVLFGCIVRPTWHLTFALLSNKDDQKNILQNYVLFAVFIPFCPTKSHTKIVVILTVKT